MPYRAWTTAGVVTPASDRVGHRGFRKKTGQPDSLMQGQFFREVVGATGLEPVTPAM